MSTKQPDGGPAFPHDEKNDDGSHFYTHPGLTIRDWFAGQALIGLSTHLNGAQKREVETQTQADARWAYQHADAMLEARENRS